MPLPDFPPLPELGMASDAVAAVIVCEDAILCLRHMAHAGTHLRLPGGWREPSESLEESCRRLVTEELRHVVREFARQAHVAAEDEALAIEVVEKIGEHQIGRLGRMHYFLVAGRGHALFTGPSAVPQVEPTRLIWRPYDWVRVDELAAQRMQPAEALDICEKGRKRANQTPQTTPRGSAPRRV
jgi:8-oxo-dGTP pyrophosphatase MutT (NUDIX family)